MDEAMNPELLDHLQNCGNLPTLPAVVQGIVELGGDSEVRIGRLADTVGLDPALTAKILRMANSAFYGRRRESHNLRQAVAVLGLEATLSIALGFSLVGSLRERVEGRLDYSLLWRRALLAGTSARALGGQLGLEYEEQLFLAALLQDIGMLALDWAMPELYRDIGQTQWIHARVQQWEQGRLGTDHAEIGAWLLRHWKFPDYLPEAVEASHEPERVVTEDPRLRIFARCVAVSGMLADIWLRDDPARLTEAAESASSQLGLDVAGLNAVLRSVSSAIPDVESLFERELASASELDRVPEEAQEVLAAWHLPVVEQAESGATVVAERAGPARNRELPGWGPALLERTVLEQTLREEFDAAGRYHWPLSLALVDLDDFDAIGAVHGQGGAAKALDAAASLLFDHTRYADVLARRGDRGFAVILPGVGAEALRSWCERIVHGFALANLWPSAHEGLGITVSVGLVTHGQPSVFYRAGDLLSAAERAVQAARAAGGNRAMMSEPDLW
jgi:diguanylate cyclase (GGDEF)-like protein